MVIKVKMSISIVRTNVLCCIIVLLFDSDPPSPAKNLSILNWAVKKNHNSELNNFSLYIGTFVRYSSGNITVLSQLIVI